MPAANALSSVEPFDPSMPGTPERLWDEFLHDTPQWSPGRQPLVVVSPHPDDEVLAAGGLMRQQVRAGSDVTVLSVTDGAAAYPDWVGLDRIRKGELATALRILGGGKIKVVHLGLEDGRVAAERARLGQALEELSRTRPIIVAPYASDGHPDHDAAGAECARVALGLGLTLIRYPVWAWHHSTPDTFIGSLWGRTFLDPATRRAKARAIECFASQLATPGRAPIVPTHVLRYFRRPYEAFLL